MFFFKSISRCENWTTASLKDFDALLNFIKPREQSSVPFSSRLVNSKKTPESYLLNRNTVLIENGETSITGAVMLSPEGVVCPILTPKSRIEPLQKIIKSSAYFKTKYLTIMGAYDSVSVFEGLFRNRKRLSVDYNLLSADSHDIRKSIRSYLETKKAADKGISVHRATGSDLNRLMPLRKAYEIEEVLLNPENFIESACRRRFAATISEQAVFFAEKTGSPIAKSCINASGIDWLQIGGVYTLPEYRSRGISAMLMVALAEYAVSVRKNLTLFVKKDNIAAAKLYFNCGFIKNDNFRISYLESR